MKSSSAVGRGSASKRNNRQNSTSSSTASSATQQSALAAAAAASSSLSSSFGGLFLDTPSKAYAAELQQNSHHTPNKHSGVGANTAQSSRHRSADSRSKHLSSNSSSQSSSSHKQQRTPPDAQRQASALASIAIALPIDAGRTSRLTDYELWQQSSGDRPLNDSTSADADADAALCKQQNSVPASWDMDSDSPTLLTARPPHAQSPPAMQPLNHSQHQSPPPVATLQPHSVQPSRNNSESTSLSSSISHSKSHSQIFDSTTTAALNATTSASSDPSKSSTAQAANAVAAESDQAGLDSGLVLVNTVSPALHTENIVTVAQPLATSATNASGSAVKQQPPTARINQLSLLYDPPIATCELKPYVSMTDRQGNATAVSIKTHKAAVKFVWSRGLKRVCTLCTRTAQIQCVACAREHLLQRSRLEAEQKAQQQQQQSKSNTASPNSEVTLHSNKPVKMLSRNSLLATTPQKHASPVKSSTPASEKSTSSVHSHRFGYYCSEQCMLADWSKHKQIHSSAQSLHDDKLKSSTSAHDSCNPLFPLQERDEWTQCSTEMCYTPTVDDVGCALRLEVRAITNAPEIAKAQAADLSEVSAQLGAPVLLYTLPVLPVPPLPPPRSLVQAAPLNSASSLSLGQSFTCMCYNVLAEVYATRHIYPYAAVWALAWEYRRTRIMAEIERYSTNLIALQEVQSNHYHSFFKPKLDALGYDGVFKRKTRESHAQQDETQDVMDGCAIFWRRDRFILHSQYGISYDEAGRQQFANDRKALRRVLKGNVALVVMLEELHNPESRHGRINNTRQRKRKLCVCNTHIFWDVAFSEVKLWQTHILTQELEKLIAQSRRDNVSLLLCGDFNSLPDSSVYELLSSERVDGGLDADPAQILPPAEQLTHRLGLQSAYGACVNEAKFTNYTGHFVGSLDYIWYSRAGLRCCSVYDIDDESIIRAVSSEDAQDCVGLPNKQFGSDHLPLIAEFDWLLDM